MTRAITMVVAGLFTLTAGLVAGPPANGAAVADARNFESVGTVVGRHTVAPANTPQDFVLGSDATLPTWAESARSEDGTVTIYVRPDTKFYNWDPSINAYRPSSFDSVTTIGNNVKVGGRTTLVNGTQVLDASYVWTPPMALPPRPANPQPSELKDYSFQRTFNVVGTVTETGLKVPYNGPWSEQFGFVMGNLTQIGGGQIVADIAAAHSGKLPITVSPTTKYWVQGSDGLMHPSTKAEAVKNGKSLRAAGKFAWVDLDWRFLASYVWQPNQAAVRGSITWTAAAQQTTPGGYQADNVGGNGEVNPGNTILSLTFDDPGTGLVNFTGTWEAGHSTIPGRLYGTVTGTWDPAFGSFDGLVVLTSGTARYAGLTGSGVMSGQGVPGVRPTSLQLAVDLTVERP